MTSNDPSRRHFIAAATALSAGLAAADELPPLAPPDAQPPNLKLPPTPSRKVGWAVVGIGQLSLEEILPAFAQCQRSRLVALVSGHPDKAKKVAAAYGVSPRAIYDYKNYDSLADNKEVDVVYIVLPNSMHAEFTIRGHEAGKHVLCEKPMATKVAECERMIAAANKAKKKLMIAYRLHYEPYNKAAIQFCRKKTYGPIRSISASNNQSVKAPNIRLSKKLGGGPLGDIGIYCLNATRYLTGEEPVEVAAFAHRPKDDPRFREVPEGVSFVLRFPSGVLASCDCDFASMETRRYRVHCAEGFIDLDPAFSYRGLRMHVKAAGDGAKELQFGEVNQFAVEMDHFSECVLTDKKPLTPGEEGLADMRVIAAIEEAAATGRTVKLSS